MEWEESRLRPMRAVPAKLSCCLCRSFTHFLTGVCAIIGGMFTGKRSQNILAGNRCPRIPCAVGLRVYRFWAGIHC